MQTLIRVLARCGAIALLSTPLLAIPAEARGQEAAAAPPTPEGPPACDAGWFGRVTEQARRAVVRVSTYPAWGAGFLLDAKHVATNFETVERPDRLRVHTGDGHSVGAHVVAGDAKDGVAILELDAPLPGTPLELSPAAPEVGQEVVTTSVPSDFGASGPQPLLIFNQGRISERRDDRVAIDKGKGVYSAGGPLLDCHGRVAGVMTSRPAGKEPWGDPMAHAILVDTLRAARATVGRRPRYTGPLVVHGIDMQFLMVQFEHGKAGAGSAISVDHLFADRWELAYRVGFLGFPNQKSSAEKDGILAPSTVTWRFSTDLRMGHRIPLLSAPVPISLVPSIGIAAHGDFTIKKTYTPSFDDPGCPSRAAVCTGRAVLREEDSTQLSLLPFVGLGARVHMLTMGYELRVNVFPDVHLVHTITWGFGTF
jgi:hypothetical protein